MTIPSRTSNPFATCWIDPQRAPLCVVEEQELEQLAVRLQERGWRGALVGPHGVGKTTLARALVGHLQPRGVPTIWRELHAGDQRQARDLFPPAETREGTLLVVDGYEQLSCWQRWQLRKGCRSRGLGLLVTAHQGTWLPTLMRLSPRVDVALAVYRRLARQVPTPVTPEDVRAAFDAQQGNLRNVLFQLYDLHEMRRPGAVGAEPGIEKQRTD
jgi:GTPase SAR1 family protein